MKKMFLCLVLLCVPIILFAETLTITTYYPAPYGVYNELRSKKMAIGDTYFDENQNDWGGTINNDADLVVEGRAGIGLTAPSAQLHVRGVDSAVLTATGPISNVPQGANFNLYASASDTEGLEFHTYRTSSDRTSSRIFFKEDDNRRDGFSLVYESNNSAIFPGANMTGLTNFSFNIMRHSNSAVGVAALTINRGNGNVGIGTITPGQELHIVRNGATADIRLQRSGFDYVDFYSSNASAGVWSYGDRPLRFATNGAESMRITGDGDVGINKSDPGCKLHVVSTDNVAIMGTGIAAGVSGVGDTAGVTGLGNNDKGVIGYGPTTGVVGYGLTGILGIGTAYGGRFDWTNLAGGATTTWIAGSNYGLRTDKPIRVVAITYPSDRRQKKNITPIKNSLKKTLALEGVAFEWKSLDDGVGKNIGFIAQDVKKIIPEVVDFPNDEVSYYGLDYGMLTPILAEAIQELKVEKDKEIGRLETENEELRRSIASIEKRLKMLER
ncbi:MAG: hypothetical protein GY858_07990 [Candidatus Omnitrophica bacterium]|nr:hypothetical protein [Candidatus Omnitrophota bacterium]